MIKIDKVTQFNIYFFILCFILFFTGFSITFINKLIPLAIIRFPLFFIIGMIVADLNTRLSRGIN